MLTAKQNGKIVIARYAQKPGEFTCPECGELVTLRKGSVKVHHFAHRSTSDCGYGKGESELHMDLKMQIFDALVEHPNVESVEIEKSFGAMRADVFAVISGRYVAFEIQLSALSIDDLVRRTQNYANNGIAVIWILHLAEGSSVKRFYQPAAWERWIHTCELGQLFLWAGSGLVRPLKLGNRSHGLLKAPKAHIAEDFTTVRKGVWDKGDFYIPERLLWMRKKGAGRNQ